MEQVLVELDLAKLWEFRWTVRKGSFRVLKITYAVYRNLWTVWMLAAVLVEFLVVVTFQRNQRNKCKQLGSTISWKGDVMEHVAIRQGYTPCRVQLLALRSWRWRLPTPVNDSTGNRHSRQSICTFVTAVSEWAKLAIADR
ncbi:hypothetical protein Y032_0143g2377 [Ancylostoma ceylanicum]|uniref:Uncharacterized protein n=1 Tax=Ancylostoma ceylanicum TaxID=53326 RepID=A0A016T337_9BILA|nr:hypothetical protein Y032_0143g2377 [Ancylostoma ceylanicum]